MSTSQIPLTSAKVGADAATGGGSAIARDTGGRSEVFSQLLPALSGGARGLRDPASFLAIGIVLALTLAPALMVVGAIALQGLAPTAQFGTRGGFAQFGAALVVMVVFGVLALTWSWMAVSVRAASLARGEPLGTWRSVVTGLKRWLVALAALLALLVVPLVFLMLHVVARSMAGIMVLSIVSLVLTVFVMIGLFLALLALLLGFWFVAAFAAADLRAGVGAVLRRTLRLATSNPGAMALLVVVTLYVSLLIVQVLSLPALASFAVGSDISVVAGLEGRTVTSGLMVGLLSLFVLVLLLIPVVFVASTLTTFVVRLGPEVEEARIGAILADLRSRLGRAGRASERSREREPVADHPVEPSAPRVSQQRQSARTDPADVRLEDLPAPETSLPTPDREPGTGPNAPVAGEESADSRAAPATASPPVEQPDHRSQGLDLSSLAPPDVGRRAED